MGMQQEERARMEAAEQRRLEREERLMRAAEEKEVRFMNLMQQVLLFTLPPPPFTGQPPVQLPPAFNYAPPVPPADPQAQSEPKSKEDE